MAGIGLNRGDRIAVVLSAEYDVTPLRTDPPLHDQAYGLALGGRFSGPTWRQFHWFGDLLAGVEDLVDWGDRSDLGVMGRVSLGAWRSVGPLLLGGKIGFRGAYHAIEVAGAAADFSGVRAELSLAIGKQW